MKKFTLLLCLFVVSLLMPQLVWADEPTYPSVSYDSEKRELVITTNAAGTLTSALVSSYTAADTIVFVGQFNSADLDKVRNSAGFSNVKKVDMANAVFVDNYTYSSRPTGSVFGYEWFSEAPVGRQSSVKAFVGGQLFQASTTTKREWVVTTDNINWDTPIYADTAVIPKSVEPGSYAKIPKAYKYRQITFTPGSWSSKIYSDGSDEGETTTQYGDYDFTGQNHWNDITSDKVKFYKYYRFQEDNNWRHWAASDETTFNQELPSGAIRITAAEAYSNNYREEHTFPSESTSIIGSVLQICYYYEKQYNKEWSEAVDELPEGATSVDGNFDYSYCNDHKDDGFTDGQWVKMYSEYEKYQLKDVVKSRTWNEITDSDSEIISFVYSINDPDDVSDDNLAKNTTATNGQYAVVGGTEYVYTGSAWEPASTATSIIDWKQMKFEYWKPLQTIILPAGILSTDLYTEGSGVWGGDDNKKSLSKVQSGVSYAEITHIDNNADNREATIYATSNDEFIRIKEILLVNSLIGSESQIHKSVVTSDYIERIAWYEGHEVYHVHVTETGSLCALLESMSISDRSVLWFDNGCVVNAQDLLALANNNPKYYVDLYDIVDPNIENAILGAITTMRSGDLQYKGLVLPKNPQTVGTTLIMDRAEDATKKATCSEFVAYRNKSTISAYIYNGDDKNNRGEYVNRLTMLRDMLQAPAHNGDIVDNTTIYCISSNATHKIGNENSGVITNTVVDIIGTDKTIIETVNNEMVNGVTTPNIYVLSRADDDFCKADSATSIAKTPRVDLIQLEGKISSKDVKTVNSFISGVRVLDIKEAESNSCIYTDNNGSKKNMLDSLKTVGGNTISQLHYIILPEGLDTTVVRNYPTNLPNLKAIISIGDTLVGHLNKTGHLAEARKLTTENSKVPSAGLKMVTLTGKLNANDIKADGEGNQDGLHGDATTIVTMDLEKAVFYNDENGSVVDCSQMNFANAGFHGSTLSLKHVKLPTDVRMDTIPENCFYETKSLDSLCIPFNYKVILDGALNETNISHITTTDDLDGAFIDNGPNTYTFSRNLTQLGTTPYVVNEGVRVESLWIDANTPRPVYRSVFPKETGVKDIYNMATLVPKCYKNVFEYSLTFGYGGQDQTKVYCRDRYYNNGDTRKSFTVLRYPSEEVYNRRKTKPGRTYETTYALMEQKYTDVTKVYTKKDQTGAVDANGNPLLWPSRTEGNRTYNQACVGALWNDWSISYAGENNSEINDGADGNVSADTTLNKQNQNNPSRRLVQRRSNPHSDLINYLGWHQIVLTQATYFEPVEEEKNVVIRRDYEDAGWFTFCIPFDMTYSQVVKMMGVPASTDKVESYYNGTKVENNDSMPDIRQLKSVIRTPNKNNTNTNEILFRLTSNLADKENKTAKYYNFEQSGVYWVPSEQSAAKEGETDKCCLVGGRPYVIKAYKRAGETITAANLGKYILTRYADEFSSNASCVNTDGTYEQLDSYTTSGGDVVVDNNNKNLVTMKFAKPYEDHKVQAYLNSETNGGQLMFKDSKGNEHPYYYAMVGQFWQQDLPQYCVYMTRSQNWRIYTDPTKNFVWDPYKCVIMATPEVTTTDRVLETTLTADTAKTVVGAVTESLIPNATAQTVTIDDSKKLATPADYATSFNRWGGGFRYVPFCYFPMNYSGTKDWIPAPMTLWFFGRNDNSFAEQDQFTKNSSLTRYVFSLDDDDDIFDFGDEATAVKTIDTLNGEMQLSGSTRVYTLSGQYMGNTTEGLSKGVYIVGGRKIVVE